MLPPGPRTSVVWNTLELMLRPAQLLARTQRRYGDIFRIDTMMLDAVFVCSPALAKEVFAHDPHDYGHFSAVIGDTIGEHGLPLTSGAKHRGQRKLLNPRFHGAQVKRFLDAMKAVTERRLAAWDAAARDRSVVRMLDVGQDISLDTIVETVFGAGAHERERARAVLGSLLDGFSPLVLFAQRLRTRAFPPWRAFLKRRAAFDAFVRDTLARRRREPPADDVVSMLLDVRDEAGAPMSDDEIRDHLLVLLLAGRESTGIAMAWAVYWLLREPRVLARLRSELDALGVDPPVEALVRAEYLGAVCNESLRIRPIFNDVVRTLAAPVELGGWTVPKGRAIVVALQTIMNDPAIFPEPERFRPERFLERSYGPGEFAPFGGGHRRCLGAAFAEHELRIVLATIVAGWELELVDTRPERTVRHHVIMTPARGVRVRVVGRRRRRAQA